MTQIIGIPFGWLMYFLYSIFKNYGFSLIIFTLITKLILFPLAIKQQKSMAKTQRINPKLEALKKKYGKNKEKYQEEMMKLYSEEGVNPMGSCLPLLIQFPILFGLIDVVYRPLTHIFRFSSATITEATKIINETPVLEYIKNNKQFNSRPEIFIMQAVEKSPESFSSISNGFTEKVAGFDYTFFGIFLGDSPSWKSILVLIPIVSLIANLLVTIITQSIQRKTNPAMKSMGNGMNTMLYMMPLFSFWFAFQVPAGVGLYWIFSSVFSCLQTIILYKIYTPERIEMLIEKERKKKKSRPSFYQKAMEARQIQQGVGTDVAKSGEDDYKYPGDEHLSKSAIKELNKQKLNEARRKMAEKYGDDYKDND